MRTPGDPYFVLRCVASHRFCWLPRFSRSHLWGVHWLHFYIGFRVYRPFNPQHPFERIHPVVRSELTGYGRGVPRQRGS